MEMSVLFDSALTLWTRVSKYRDVVRVRVTYPLTVQLPRQSVNNRSRNVPMKGGPCLAFPWAYRRALSYDGGHVWNGSLLW